MSVTSKDGTAVPTPTAGALPRRSTARLTAMALWLPCLASNYLLGNDAVKYSLSVTPPKALLGERISVFLRCSSSRHSPQVLTFDHKSLTLELARPGSGTEPSYTFPNRKVILEGTRLIREGSSGGIEALRTGEERSRSFELTLLFPMQLLDVGDFQVGYTLSDGQREIRAQLAHVRVLSGADSVPLLFRRLAEEDLATRTRAAGLLHRMTARGLLYDPAADATVRAAAAAKWKTWWQAEGSKLPWVDDADGVVFGQTQSRLPKAANGTRLGGVAYHRSELTGPDRAILLAAMEAWQRQPTLAALRGDHFVGDQLLTYPSDATVVANDAEILRAFAGAFERLRQLALSKSDHVAEARLILFTAAKMPSAGLVVPLSSLESAISADVVWASVAPLVAGILDFLDPGRVLVTQPKPNAGKP